MIHPGPMCPDQIGPTWEMVFIFKTKAKVGPFRSAPPLSVPHTYTNTHARWTHTFARTERGSERDPKHQNSINPPRRSLKGFLKADFQAARRLSRSALFVAPALLKHSSSSPSPFHSASSYFFPACIYSSFSLNSFLFICPRVSSETG